MPTSTKDPSSATAPKARARSRTTVVGVALLVLGVLVLGVVGAGVLAGRGPTEPSQEPAVEPAPAEPEAAEVDAAPEFGGGRELAGDWPGAQQALRIAADDRHFVRGDGTPFFWLGDTAWRLASHLDREQAERYLQDRADKGFTVVQINALYNLDDNDPNAYGETPLVSTDPLELNEDYLEQVGWVLDRADDLGLYVALVPDWGHSSVPNGILDEENSREYGRTLGERFRDQPNLVWLLGGDYSPSEDEEDVIREIAAGVIEGDEGRHLISYHGRGEEGRSSKWFHDDEWLDFNAIQSGHRRLDRATYEQVGTDYELDPVKPTLDIESPYEAHAIDWEEENGFFDAYDVRQGTYWALFAGGAGKTYGHDDVWRFREDAWEESLDADGAQQMTFVRELMESRPFSSQAPDLSVLLEGQSDGGAHVEALRATDGSHLMLYLAQGEPVTVDLDALSGYTARAWWFDPRTGEAEEIGEFDTDGGQDFEPPSTGRGEDWVLVVDDAARDFGPPGG